MNTNVGKTIQPTITAEQGAAVRILQSSERIYRQTHGLWTDAMRELWDHWTDEERTVRDGQKVADILSAMGTDAEAAFADSATVSGMLSTVSPEPVTQTFQKYSLWEEDAGERVVPVTVNGDGTVSYDATLDPAAQ